MVKVNVTLKTLAISLVILSVSSCSPEIDKTAILTVTEVSQTGTDGDGSEFCSDFSLSQESAQNFLNQAKPITFAELHDQHEYLPCYTRGKATHGKETCTWEIRAGNTGELTCPDRTIFLACDDCLPLQSQYKNAACAAFF